MTRWAVAGAAFATIPLPVAAQMAARTQFKRIRRMVASAMRKFNGYDAGPALPND